MSLATGHLADCSQPPHEIVTMGITLVCTLHSTGTSIKGLVRVIQMMANSTSPLQAPPSSPLPSCHSDTGEEDEEFRTPHGSPPPSCNEEADFRLRTRSDGSMVIVSAQSSPLEGHQGDMKTDGHVKGPLASANSDIHFSSQHPPEDHHVLTTSQDATQLSPAMDDVTQPPAAADNVDKLSLSVDDVCELPQPAVNNGTKSSPPVDSVTQPSSSDDGIIGGYKEIGSNKQEDASNSHAPPSSQDESELDGAQPSLDQPKMKVAPTVTVQFESGINSLAVAMGITRGQNLKVAGVYGGKKQPRLVINDSSNSFSDSEFVTPAEGMVCTLLPLCVAHTALL